LQIKVNLPNINSQVIFKLIYKMHLTSMTKMVMDGLPCPTSRLYCITLVSDVFQEKKLRISQIKLIKVSWRNKVLTTQLSNMSLPEDGATKAVKMRLENASNYSIKEIRTLLTQLNWNKYFLPIWISKLVTMILRTLLKVATQMPMVKLDTKNSANYTCNLE